MKNRDIIYESLQLIEENLQSDITVFSLSQKYGFSHFYFSRLFKGVTGYPPKTYILHRKISHSVSELLHSSRKIIEIAFDYGFATPESYSRACNKILGVNPSDIRKSGSIDRNLLFRKITKDTLEKNRFLKKQEPSLIQSGPILLVGIPFYYDLSLKNDLSQPWQNLIQNVHTIPARCIPERYYQVQFWVEGQDTDTIYFFIAAEVEEIYDIPIQFTAKTLPLMQYLKFYHKGKSNTVGETYRYIYEEFLPDTEYRLPHTYNFEFCGELYTGPYDDNSISEIYIPVE